MGEIVKIHNSYLYFIFSVSRIWELSGSSGLNEKSLNSMQSVISKCEVVSAHDILSAKMEIKFVEEKETEENKVNEMIEIGKVWTMEGKVDQISYAIEFRSAINVQNHVTLQ